MKRLGVCACAWLILAFCPATTLAQKIPIYVHDDGVDVVGKDVISTLKEAIQRSESMALITDQTPPHIKLRILTMDDSIRDKGLSSAIAVSFVYDSFDTPLYGMYIMMAVSMCGKDKVDTCAENLLTTIATAVERLRKRAPELWDKLISPKTRVSSPGN
jgi:hypothetical protein